MFREAIHYARTGRGLRLLAKATPVADPESTIRTQFENREFTFLELVRSAIFENPSTPYHRMFQLARCTFEDLRGSITRNGLDLTLRDLRNEGVHLTHQEFKGTQPIIRGGEHIPSDPSTYLNPSLGSLYHGSSSGSRGKRMRTPYSLDFVLFREAHTQMRYRELGAYGRAHSTIKPILPSTNGLQFALRSAEIGLPAEQWFAVGGQTTAAISYRVLTAALLRYARTSANAPLPTYLPQNDFSPVARWIAGRMAQGRSCVIDCTPSAAVRVVAAAEQLGFDVGGTLFLAGGEGISEAKRAAVEKADARVYISYPMSEVGTVGHACSAMNQGNCVHLFEDTVAVITHRQVAPFSQQEVDVLLFTTLLRSAGQVLINADLGDTGTIESTSCDCHFSRMGLRRQIRDIASYAKLTGHGVTLVGTDMVRVLEEYLPSRLGGSPGDYQLVQHDGASQMQLTLRVSSRAGTFAPEQARACFFEGIQSYYGGSLAARHWAHADSLEVIIAEPLLTATGKVLSLHLSVSARSVRDAS